MRCTVRPETAADSDAIDALTIAAFRGAPHASHTEHFIVRALRRAHQLTVSLVAEHDGELLGHVAVSPVMISDGTQGWYGLGPVSVAPERQRRGIGKQLIREALLALQRSGARGCVVVGDPAYYGRFGFATDSRLRLEGVAPQYFQALPFMEQLPTGTVTFHEAFRATE
jgi:putative acetyltransferase